MSKTTVIRNAAWVVAWDTGQKKHCYRTDIDVAWTDNKLVYIDPHYGGPVDTEISGHGLMVMPGLVNVHSHPSGEPLDKGFNEELRSPRLGMSGLYEYMPLIRADAEGVLAASEVAFSELMLSGVTTLTDISGAWDGWLDLFDRSGLRGCVAPAFRNGPWFTRDGFTVEYDLDDKTGRDGMEKALQLIERARQHPSGRMMGMMMPSQVDTCTEELLRDAKTVSDERDLPIQLHAAQSIVEFDEMKRRHGLTSIQWLEQIGFLGSNTILSHAIFVDSHSWVRWHTNRDLDLLAESGTAVAHCPQVFLRGGMLLENLGDYLKRGINVGLGTDTYPHNYLNEMFLATTLARVAGEHVDTVSTAAVLECATVRGAKMLKRDDIGRLEKGCKADLALIDLNHPEMRPLRDPLRSLIYSAKERPVKDVYVDGNQVVKDHKVLHIDHEDALGRLEAAQRRAFEKAPGLDWANRPIEEISPMALPWGKK
jgi:cytosine/adenosine deaminase-related metal-dependent hydrolase